MNTTQKTARKHTGKPVTATLLELAYFLHTTKVVGLRETPTEPLRQEATKGQQSGGSSLAS